MSLQQAKTHTINLNKNQLLYQLPIVPELAVMLEVYNKKKNTWEQVGCRLYVEPFKKMLKTDTTLKITIL